MKLVSMIYFILILIAIYMSLYLMNSIDGFTTSPPMANTSLPMANTSPPMANFGTNVWRSSFDNSLREFDKRYKHVGVLKYPNHYTVTGEFIDDGPLEWNI
jgi:hypothetical protein